MFRSFYEKYKEAIRPFVFILVYSAIFFLLGYGFGAYRTRQAVRAEWERVTNVKQQLEQAQKYQRAATREISKAAGATQDAQREVISSRAAVAEIQRSTDESQRQLSESRRLIDECQSILDQVVERGKEN